MTRKWALPAALAVLLLTCLLLEITKKTVPAADYQEKIDAAQRTADCLAFIREEKERRGIPLSAADSLNSTGLVGEEYTAITTTLGNLEAKRTSVNPNMAAMVVDMFHELGLQAGDKVAVNCSGSFPALNIAVLCAIDTLSLDPIMISSFGASTYGANSPDFTYLDMENALYQAGLLSHRSAWFSAGGMEDMGREMAEDVRTAVIQRLEGLGYAFFEDDDLLHNIRDRYGLYNSYGNIACFINVGGNDASFGDSSVIVHADGGILTALPDKDRSTGLVQLFLRDHVPVVHLLNVKSLAAAYGLPVDPTPVPTVGEGGVYFTTEWRRGIAVVGLLAALLALCCARRKSRAH